jgi:hypothetical protein
VTVKELIEKLKEFDEDMEVFTFGPGVGGNEFDTVAWEPYVKTQYVKYEAYTKQNYVALRPCEATAGARKCLLI